MIYALFALFIVLPLLELWVLIQVGTVIGALPTVALVVAISLFGAWMVRQQSLSALMRAQASLRDGHMPVGAVADGAGLMLAAILIMTPGLITSAIGALLLVPPVRRWLLSWSMRRIMRHSVYVRADSRFHQPSRRPAAWRRDRPDDGVRSGRVGPGPSSAGAANGPVIEVEFEKMDDGSNVGTGQPDGADPSSPDAKNRASNIDSDRGRQ